MSLFEVGVQMGGYSLYIVDVRRHRKCSLSMQDLIASVGYHYQTSCNLELDSSDGIGACKHERTSVGD